jgi:hypothetical protein
MRVGILENGKLSGDDRRTDCLQLLYSDKICHGYSAIAALQADTKLGGVRGMLLLGGLIVPPVSGTE